MKRKASFPAIIVILFVLGCIRSLHPLYEEKNLIFDPQLEGSWFSAEPSEKWVFDYEKEGRFYRLTYTDEKGKSGTFKAHFFKLGESTYFLDFSPVVPDKNQELNGMYQYHLMGIHTFARVVQILPELQLQFPDVSWLQRSLDSNSVDIPHDMVNSSLLLTGSTEELQNFFLSHAENKELFAHKRTLRKDGEPSPVLH